MDIRMIRKLEQARETRAGRGVAKMFRTAAVEVSGVVCSCGKHYALKVTNTNGTIVRESMCPLAFWLQCQSFLSLEERVQWQSENPAPSEYIIVEQINYL